MSMDLTKLFCFTYPIGWDEIGVIATVIAVVVALAANQSSRKQLVKALEMQEQSKNVELLGQRINVIDSIQADVLVSETAIKLLFNKSVLSCYQTLKQQKAEYESAKNDEATFFRQWRKQKSLESQMMTSQAEFRNMNSLWNGQIVLQKFLRNIRNTVSKMSNGGLKQV